MASDADLISRAILIGDVMPNQPSDAAFQISDSVTVSTEARAAAQSTTKAEHVWHLELALSALRRCAHPTVIDRDTHDVLQRDLLDAMRTSERLLSGFYPEEQIDRGYRAALGVLAAWMTPGAKRLPGQVYGTCGLVLGMFFFDVVNMRRLETLAGKTGGAPLDTILPPLPRLPSAAPCVVVPFPGSTKGPR